MPCFGARGVAVANKTLEKEAAFRKMRDEAAGWGEPGIAAQHERIRARLRKDMRRRLADCSGGLLERVVQVQSAREQREMKRLRKETLELLPGLLAWRVVGLQAIHTVLS